MKYCKKCNQDVEEKFFHKSKTTKDKLQVYCKSCMYSYNEYSRKRRLQEDKDNDLLDFYNMKSNKRCHYVAMYELLRKLNYNIETDVHQQFCDKYGLIKKERPPKSINRWSYPDLDELIPSSPSE